MLIARDHLKLRQECWKLFQHRGRGSFSQDAEYKELPCEDTDHQESLSQFQNQSNFTRLLNSTPGANPLWPIGPGKISPWPILPSLYWLIFLSTLAHFPTASLPQNHSICRLDSPGLPLRSLFTAPAVLHLIQTAHSPPL